MQGPMRAAGALLIAAACATPQAQTIYRCGNSYGSQPCADGRSLDAAAAPTAADRSQATANTRRDAQLADTLQKDRLRQEAQAGNAFYPPPPAFDPDRPSERKPTDKAGSRKLDVFTATVPGTVHAKKGAKDHKTDRKHAKESPAAPAVGAGKSTAPSVKAAPPAKKGS